MDWIDILEVGVYDTENPVPREEGPQRKHRSAAFKNIGVGLGGLGVGYAGVKIGKAAEHWGKSSPRYIVKSLLQKARRAIHLEARLSEIRLARGDYAKKYLPFDPLLHSDNPFVKAQVAAVLTHQRPLSEKKQKAKSRELGRTAILKSGYIPRDVEAMGPRRAMPSVKIVRPYRKTRAEMNQQARSVKEPPKAPEPMPGEMLPRQRGKMPARGADYEGVSEPPLFSTEEARKEGKITYLYPNRQHPHNRPSLTPEEVSVKGREFRDPLAWHRARVKAGMTLNLIETRDKPKKNLPKQFLPHPEEVESRREAQQLSDTLAGRLKEFRKDILQPLRARARKLRGLPPVQPMGAEQVGALHSESEAMGNLPIAPNKPFKKPKIKTMVPIGGRNIHPTVLAAAHEKLKGEIEANASKHMEKATAISDHIENRLQQAFGQKQYGNELRDTVSRLKNDSFSPNKTFIEDSTANTLAEHMGVTPEWIKTQHAQYAHHAHLGQTGVGEEKIRRALTLSLFKRTKGNPARGAGAATYSTLKRIGAGAGIAAGLGAAAYGGYKLLNRKKETQFSAIGELTGSPRGRGTFVRTLYPSRSKKDFFAAIGDIKNYHKEIGGSLEDAVEAMAKHRKVHAHYLDRIRTIINRRVGERLQDTSSAYRSGVMKGQEGVRATEKRLKDLGHQTAFRIAEARKSAAQARSEAGRAVSKAQAQTEMYKGSLNRTKKALVVTGIGGTAAGVGTGLYVGSRNDKKMKETQFEAGKSALGNIKHKLLSRTGKHELIIGGALTGGITAADAVTSAVNPDPDKTRKQSAIAGAGRGFLYGSVLSGVEPAIRRPLSRRFLAFDDGSNTLYPPPPGKKRRLTVAQDRYRKQIRGREIERKESNLGKSALAGGLLGAALRGKRLSLGTAAGVGAVGGIGAQVGTMLHGRKTKDVYGEESISAKRIERLPYQLPALAAAGIVGRNLYKRFKFNSNGGLIRFQQITPIEPEGKSWQEKQVDRYLKHPKTRAEEVTKWYKRAKRIHEDIKAPKDKSGMIVDERGRTRTPEYKKDWFKRAAVVAPIAGALAVGGLARMKLRSIAETAAGAVEKGLPVGKLTATEKFAAHATHGNIGRYLKGKFPKTVGTVTGAGGLVGRVRGELKALREGGFKKLNKVIEGETGPIEHMSLKRSGLTDEDKLAGLTEGKPIGIKITSPAWQAEHLKKLDEQKAIAEKRVAGVVRERKKAMKIGKGQASIEEAIAPKKLESRLRLIHFQENDRGEVYVKPHTRRPRRYQRPDEKKSNREAFLAAAGGAGILSSLGIGTYAGLTHKERQLAHARKLEESIAKRLAEAKITNIHRASSLLDDIIQFRVATPKTYLIRHGCTSFNKEGLEIGQSAERIRGHIDIPLNRKGQEQAVKIGKKLKGKPIDHIYTSDLSRAHETAAIISEHMGGVPVTPVYGLRPWALGKDIEGKDSNKVQPKINHLVDTPDIAPDEGESLNNFKDRFLGTLQEIREKHPQGSIAVVTHYRGIKLLNSINGDGELQPRKFKSNHTPIEPGKFEVIKHDDHSPQ